MASSHYSQAQALDEAGVAIDEVVALDVDDEEIVKRLSGRRVHEASGRIYHVEYNPPRVPGQDDQTGEPLIQRQDDQEETVRRRLEVYRDQTQPLVDFYQGLAADRPTPATREFWVPVRWKASAKNLRSPGCFKG